jgi:hypothetical protein
MAIFKGLQDTKYYTLGCKSLHVATDHQPLVTTLSKQSVADVPDKRLARIKEKGVRQRLVGLEIEGLPFVGTNDFFWPVMKDGTQVGTVTSAVYSPRLDKNIALGMLSVEHTDIGTQLIVDKLGETRGGWMRRFAPEVEVEVEQRVLGHRGRRCACVAQQRERAQQPTVNVSRSIGQIVRERGGLVGELHVDRRPAGLLYGRPEQHTDSTCEAGCTVVRSLFL